MGDITKYKDKINPDKEYEIIGQDILDVINTIDSLKNETNTINFQPDTLWARLTDTVYVNKYDTIHTTKHDTIYVNQIKNEKKMYEGYSFYIVFGLLMCLAVWLHKFKLMD